MRATAMRVFSVRVPFVLRRYSTSLRRSAPNLTQKVEDPIRDQSFTVRRCVQYHNSNDPVVINGGMYHSYVPQRISYH